MRIGRRGHGNRRSVIAVAIVVVVCAAAVGISVTAAFRGAVASPHRVTIVATSNIDGQMHGCSCGDGSVPGLVKFASVLRELTAGGAATIVDTGNFFSPGQEPELDLAMVEIADTLGYSAIALGDQEFSNGVGSLVEIAGHFPVGSVNVEVKTPSGWRRLAHPVVAHDALGEKLPILIVPLSSPSMLEGYPTTLTDSVRFVDPRVALSEVLGDASESGDGNSAAHRPAAGRSRLVVLLYHGVEAEARALAAETAARGVDAVVYGRRSDERLEQLESGVWIGSPGARGNVALVLRARRRLFSLPDTAGRWVIRAERVESNYYVDSDDEAAAALVEPFICEG